MMEGEWYYCYDCKEVFSSYQADVRMHSERHYWLDDKPIEVFYEHRCPFCGSDDITEAAQCEECGNYFLPDDLDINFMCPECAKEYENTT